MRGEEKRRETDLDGLMDVMMVMDALEPWQDDVGPLSGLEEDLILELRRLICQALLYLLAVVVLEVVDFNRLNQVVMLLSEVLFLSDGLNGDVVMVLVDLSVDSGCDFLRGKSAWRPEWHGRGDRDVTYLVLRLGEDFVPDRWSDLLMHRRVMMAVFSHEGLNSFPGLFHHDGGRLSVVSVGDTGGVLKVLLDKGIYGIAGGQVAVM